MRIQGTHAGLIKKFNARDRHAHLYGLNHGIDRAINAGKRADRCRDRFWLWIQLQRDLNDDAECAFTTHK